MNLICFFSSLKKPCALGRYFPPIEAIVLFGESVRWETNLQLIIDVLMVNGKLDQTAVHKFPLENLPILACNTDMVWMSESPMPRFGHGTFLHCLEQIYHKLSGKDLKYTAIVGKPCEITYYYAERMIQSHAASIGIHRGIKRLYAVGDNLDTDIYGANVYNQILENNKRYRDKKLSKQAMAGGDQIRSSGSGSGMFEAILDDVQRMGNVSSSSKTSSGSSSSSKAKLNSPSLLSTSNYSTKSNASYVSDTESIASILVRTGVFRGDTYNPNIDMNLAHKDMIVDLSLMKPNFIVDNVFDAVKLVYQIEKY
jgi:hypothetical protein